jgi:hypothetical protein
MLYWTIVFLLVALVAGILFHGSGSGGRGNCTHTVRRVSGAVRAVTYRPLTKNLRREVAFSVLGFTLDH